MLDATGPGWARGRAVPAISASAIAAIRSIRSAAEPSAANQATAIVRASASGVGDRRMVSAGRLSPNTALTDRVSSAACSSVPPIARKLRCGRGGA